MAGFLDYATKAVDMFSTPAGQSLVLGKDNVTAVEIAKANAAGSKPGAGPDNKKSAQNYAEQKDTGFGGLFANPFEAGIDSMTGAKRAIAWIVIGAAIFFVGRAISKRV